MTSIYMLIIEDPENPELPARVFRAKTLCTPEGTFVAGVDAAPGDWVLTDSEAEITEIDAGGFPTLSRKQLRLALLSIGVTTDMVYAVIEAIEDPEQRETARIFWEDSKSYHREHAMVVLFVVALKKDKATVDKAWMKAAALES